MNYNKNLLAKSAIIITVISLFSKIIGFLREILLGKSFGASFQTDAYLLAIAIPTVIFGGILGAIATTFLPKYINIRTDKGRDMGDIFTGKMIGNLGFFCLVFTFIGIIFSKQIVSLIAGGFNEETLELAIKLTRIMFPMIICIGISSILTGYLQSNNQFTIPALIGFPSNIIVIVALLLSYQYGIYGVAYATLIGAVFQILLQYPFFKKTGGSIHYVLDFKDENIRHVLVLAIPVFLGNAAQQVNLLVDRILASGLVEGSISALNFAGRLNGFVYGLFVFPIITVIYPMFAHLMSIKDMDGLKEILRTSINLIILVILPITFGAMILRVPIITLLFERGAFDARATMLTASALLFYSIGMVFFGLSDLVNRVFYGMQDTKTPMIIGSMVVFINIVLNVILVRLMAHSGLALATTISSAVAFILLIYNLRIKLGSLGGKKIFTVFAKSLFSSLIMGITVYFFYPFISGYTFVLSRTIAVFVSVMIGGLVYFVTIYLLRVDEIRWLKEMILRKWRELLK